MGVAAFSAVSAARAQEWPRFHIGGAFGEPHWSVDMAEAGVPPPPDPTVGSNTAEPGTGWKLVGGFRPVRVVGMEIEYIDLDEGHATVRGGRGYGGSGPLVTQYEQSNNLTAGFDASVLSALLFIPEGNPSLDVYGKLGVARVDESLATSVISIPCTPISQCRTTVTNDVHQSDVRPYVGMGARITLWRALAVRVEYEAIDRDVSDNLQMLSVGVAWER